MPQRIKITEEQLHKVVNVISEQEFDSAITKYKEEKNREVMMSKEDARLLLTLADNWCEGRINHPDCADVEEISKKLKL